MNKSVQSKIYTRDYYLSDCTGYEEFLRSKGRELDVRLKKIIPRLTLKSGQRLLDVGCGRGEIVFYAAKHGVDALGIDYAQAAIDLANEAKIKQDKEIKSRSRFMRMNAKKMSFENHTFDWVVMTDVVEHLYEHELEKVYAEAYRVLKPGGILLIHTEPNRHYNDITYPYYCYPISRLLVNLNHLIFGKNYPGLPHPSLLRTPMHKKMHINEATYSALMKQLSRAGFGVRIETQVTILKPKISWKDTLFNIVVCWYPLSNFWPINMWFANDFVVTAGKE